MPSAATVYQTLNLIAITCAALGGSTAARRRGLDPSESSPALASAA
jgi:uncharacterized membrane protein YeiH